MPPKKKKTDSKKSGNEEALKCFICKLKLSSENEVESHVNDEHGPRFNCQCAHCTGKRRHESAKLVEELKLKDGGKEVKVFKCIVCSYSVFLLCKCLSHIQTAHNTISLQKQYECMKCNIPFEKCLELHNHILQEHPEAQKIARCGFPHCKKCFQTANMLQLHLRSTHKVNKPFELLNSIKGTAPPKITGGSSTGSGRKESTGAVSSAWTAPDPPSPPAQTAPSIEKEEPDPNLTCKICNKNHKSQTSYNNHMLVFHKEKKACKPAKKRRRDDDSDTSSDSADSEDSDWAPGNNSSKRSSRATRASKRPPSSRGDNSSDVKTKGRNAYGGSMTEASSDTSGMNNETMSVQGSVASSDNTGSTTPHHGQGHGDHDDCLACKQAKLKSIQTLPPIRIKQEPLDPSEVPTMPVISSVFSITQSGNTIETPPRLTNGFDESAASTSVLYNSGDDHDRPPSAGSSYSSVTERGNAMLGSSPSTGWQPLAAMPSNGANMQQGDNNMCSDCLTRKPNQNKCDHCGIIFLEPTMHMIHMLWHGEKHPFQCHTCGVICKDKYSFTTHIFRAEHTFEQPQK